MKIIKPGDMRKAKKVILFICDRCGCMFEADEDEYVLKTCQYQGDWMEIHCPTCGHLVQQDC